MDFKDLLRITRRRWKTIVAILALAMIGSAALSLAAKPTYQSTSSVAISTDISNATDAFGLSFFATGRVQTYANLATSGVVLQRVINSAHLALTTTELAAKITAIVPNNTTVVTLVVTDHDARTAQLIAQAEAQQFSEFITRFETPSDKQVALVKAVVSDPASFNGTPVSPKTTLNLAIAMLLGLILGFAVAIIREMLDATIKTPSDVESVTSTPILGHIAYDSALTKHPLLTDLGSHDPRAEAFRLVRTNMQYLNPDEAPTSFVITSALPGEGKTSTATNLAIALAQAGKRVLLVDADLRRPSASRLLGLEKSVGLTTVLVGRSTIEESVQHHAISGIDFLASGPLPPNPTEILQSKTTHELLTSLSQAYDAVIIDAPPLLPVADAAIIATYVDGAIVVARHARTTRDQLKHAATRLDQVGATTSGVLINMSPKRGASGYDDTYGYGYGYGYGYAGVAATKPLAND